MFSEGSFRDGDILAVYLGFDLGSPLFGRVDGGTPEILHMRNIYGRVCCKVMVGRTYRQGYRCLPLLYDLEGRFRIWKALNVLRMKGFERGGDLRESDETVPADNLKQSVANLLLLKIKPVSS
ncbi:hypothetical protein L1987_63926 [Smallanthus sonchifolius]|uniref:Uncharacterized protein n=1 Tax=Smallanthus sonchifolius TaxID=185202 RepID=A0ACB9CEL1_9ASTR|nr:hypothetical protein L1987_63926 [Smallanthus sonchifolius]